MPATPFAQTRMDFTDKSSVMAPGRYAGSQNATKDSVPFPEGPCRSLWVGTTGDLVGRAADDTRDVTFKAVPVGWFDYQFAYLTAATTAADLVPVY